MTPVDSRTVPVEGTRAEVGALFSERESLEVIFGTVPDGVTVQTADGRLVYANAAALEALGVETLDDPLPGTGSGPSRWQVVDEKGATLAPEDLPAARILAGQPAPTMVLGYRAPGRSGTRWVNVRTSPICDASGKVTHVLAVFRDVTSERDAQLRQQFLAEASAILNETLDPNATLGTLARLAVPTLADWCAVDILSASQRFEQLAVAHVDPAKVEVGRELARRYPVTLDSPRALATVARTRQSAVMQEVSDAHLVRIAHGDPDHLALLRKLDIRSSMVVPLLAGGRVLGAMTFAVSGDNPRRYTPDDVAFAEELAARAASALDNARLFHETENTRARLDAIVNGVDGILWEADPKTLQFTFVSQRAVAMLGYALDRWTAEATFWADRLHPLDRSWALEFRATHADEAKDHEFEYRMLSADGDVVWMRDIVYVVKDAEGRPERLRGLMVDITDRKKAESRLQAQNAVATLLATAESLDAVAEDLLRLIGESFGWEAGGLWRPRESGDALTCRAAWSAPSIPSEAFIAASRARTFVKGEGIPGEVWETGRAAWVRDFAQAPHLPRAEAARAAGLHSAVGIPLWSSGQFHGVIDFFARDQRDSEDSLLEVLQSIGANIGLYLERKAAEAALRDSNARRGAILDTSLDCIVSIDHRGTVLEWNPAAEQTFGYTREEAVGQEMAKLIVPPELREAHRRGMSHYLASGHGPVLGRRIEITGVRKDGTVFPIELAILPIKREGAPIFTGHIRDITARKAMESELRASQERVKAFHDNLPIALFATTPDGRFLEANPAFAHLLGYPDVETFTATRSTSLYANPKEREAIVARLDKEGSVSGAEVEFVRRDGSHIWVRIAARAIRDGAGAVVRYDGALEDVTARRQAETAMRESDERFQLVTRATNDTIWDWDLRAGTLWWNENLHATYGHALSDLEPGIESWTNRIHPEDLERVSRGIHAAIDGADDTWSDEYRFRREDGKFATVLDRGFILRDSAGTAIRMVGSMVDVTSERQSAAALHERTQTLGTLNRVTMTLAGELDLERVIQQVTDAATEVAGAKFGAFFYNSVNDAGEQYLLYTLSGAPREAFERFGKPRATELFGPTFRGEGVIRVDDVHADHRYGKNAPHHGMPKGHLPVRSYLAVPVISRSGQVIGGLFLGHPEPARFTASHEQLVVGIAAQAAIAVDNANLYKSLEKELAERKRSESALRDSEERFRRAFADASIGMLVTSLDGRFLQANRAFATMLGYEVEEILGRSFAELTHPEDRAGGNDIIASALRGERSSVAFEKRYLHRDGTPVWTQVTSSLLRDGQGKPLHFVTQVQDVTERRRAQSELERFKRNLEQILESAGEGIYGVDAEGRTTFMNAAALKMCGLTAEEVVGQRLHDVIHHTKPDGTPYPIEECPIHQAAHGGPRTTRTTESFQSKDGGAFPVEYVTSPIRDGETVVGAVTVFKDVTERRRAEAELKRSTEHTSNILESISDAFFALDRDWRFTYVNRQAEVVLSRKKEELLGRSILEAYPGVRGSRFEEVYRRAMDEGVAGGVEDYYPDHGLWYEVKAYPSLDGVSVYFQNVSERKRAEIAIREGRERLDIALNAADLGAWDLDLVNEKAVRSLRHDQIFGYETLQENWSTERFLGHVIPEHRDTVEAAFDEAFESGRLYFECQIRRADGELAWVTAQGRTIYEDGRPARMLGVVADTTARRTTEEALQRERHLLSSILQQLPAGVIIAEMPSGRLVLANDLVNNILKHDFIPAEGIAQYSRYIGFTPEGQPIAPEEYPLARALTRGEVVTGEEVHYQTASGERIPLLVNAAPVRDAQGAIVAGVAAFIDISDLKQAENELRRNANLLSWQRRVLESIATGRDLTSTLETLCREAEAQSPGHYFSVLLVDEDEKHLRHGAAPGLPDHYNRAVDGIEIGEGVGSCGTAAFRQESVIVTDIAQDPLWKDFKDLALPIGLRACWSTPIMSASGRLLGTWAVYRSTTGDPTPDETSMVIVATRLAAVAIERAYAERDLRYQRDLVSTITDNAGSALFMMDGNGLPIFMNPAAMEMTGYASLDEIKDKPLHYAVHFRKPDGSHYPMEECPIDQANAEIRPLKDQREVFCRSNGDLFPVEYNVAPITRGPENLGAVIEVRDITEKLRAERELKSRAEELTRLADALQRSNRELDQFAYVTSHDLKAPLRGIANLSRWIEEDLGGNLTDSSREHLDLMRGRVQRMESLIEAILEYSRVGRVKGKPELVDSAVLIEDVVDLLSPPAGFKVEVEGEMPTLVAERMRLQQVFMNLIGNALKHHHAKERGHVTITAEDAGSHYAFTVKDDGPGIDPRFHEKIFVIFQTLEPRDKVEGTGIGLALVKKIVESQGGSVTLDSAEGRGAAFRFTWPKTP